MDIIPGISRTGAYYEKEGVNMNFGHGVFIILLLGTLIAGGCAATRPVGDETASLPRNEGVKDLTFLSQGEAEIARDVNRARVTAATVRLQPLKTSMGLSLAARERALELAGSNKQSVTAQDQQDRLFARVRKFGTFNGSVAEIASYGYSEGSVVEELIKNSSAGKEEPELYFMDPKFTVMGVGCTSAARLAPICVITFASEFKEAR